MRLLLSMMWKRKAATIALWCCGVAAALVFAPAVSLGGDAPQAQAKVPSASREPDRILLTWQGDPSTTQSVTWRTSAEVQSAWGEIALAEPGPAFPGKATRVPARTEPLRTDLGEVHYHAVTFERLSPSTTYVYRVGDGVHWSEWFQFTTAAGGNQPFCFLYVGDAQNNIRSMWSRVLRQAFRDAPKASFILHAGDLVDKGNSDAAWGEWFAAGQWLHAMLPSVPVPGNHEYVKVEGDSRQLTRHWRTQFTLPENGPEGLEESCYTLVYNNLRIVGLNSNQGLELQARWLDRVLGENTSTWVICVFHHPVFSNAKQRDNPELRAAWKPLFDKYRVDLVLQGHDHTYGRTGLETPGVGRDAANIPAGGNAIEPRTGTVYVVSVSGPKMYDLNRKPFVRRAAEDTQLYQVIHVDGPSLRYEARTAVGELYDAFVLKKRQGGVNELVELVPETSERLRPARPAKAASGG